MFKDTLKGSETLRKLYEPLKEHGPDVLMGQKVKVVSYTPEDNAVLYKTESVSKLSTLDAEQLAHELTHYEQTIDKYKAQLGEKATKNMKREDLRKAYNALSYEGRQKVYDKWVKSFETEEAFVEAYLKEEKEAQFAAEMVKAEIKRGPDQKGLVAGDAKYFTDTWLGNNRDVYEQKAKNEYRRRIPEQEVSNGNKK